MENNNSITAVEWLEKQLIHQKRLLPEHFNKAKQMEKEQIIDGYNNGCIHTLKDKMRKGEQYYNEIFNK